VSECGSVWVQVPRVCRLFVTVLTVSDRGPHGGIQRLTRESLYVLHVSGYVRLKLLYNCCATIESLNINVKMTKCLLFLNRIAKQNYLGSCQRVAMLFLGCWLPECCYFGLLGGFYWDWVVSIVCILVCRLFPVLSFCKQKLLACSCNSVKIAHLNNSVHFLLHSIDITFT